MSEPRALSTFPADEQPLTMSEWGASDGGRQCVECHKYRKQSDLYVVGGQNNGHILGEGIHVAISAQPVCGACLAKQAKEQGQ